MAWGPRLSFWSKELVGKNRLTQHESLKAELFLRVRGPVRVTVKRLQLRTWCFKVMLVDRCMLNIMQVHLYF